MFNLLKKKKSTNKLIAEIHETFYSEVDRLLEGAKISTKVNVDDKIAKAERLKELGFTSSREVSKGRELRKEKEFNENLIEAINHFSFKYPQYKFITEESVQKICGKYGLVHGDVNLYLGEVPERNLEQIEKFKIAEDDDCYCKERSYSIGWTDTTYKTFISKQNSIIYEKQYDNASYKSSMSHVEFYKCGLSIVAPQTDFDLQRHQIVNNKVVPIPDPIVLYPVHFKGSRHYLIVTAWGLEARDEDVINERMN